jgi:hypothetical protein
VLLKCRLLTTTSLKWPSYPLLKSLTNLPYSFNDFFSAGYTGQMIFVGDHTKFDNPALYKIADIDELDYIVTDIQPSKAWHKTANKKIKLIYQK